MKVEKPIFVVGVGRSGSTIFHRILAEHPHVAWLSSEVSDRFPNQPGAARWHMRAVDVPLAGQLFRRFLSPGEPYDFWEYHCPGFKEPCRDLVAQDVTQKFKNRLPALLSQILTTRRHRLLVKITGWPRVGFLNEIFTDAKFIHITRENAAVINSMINVDWWWGWRGPQNWRWGELTPQQKAEWDRFDRSFIALAGIELQILAEAMEKAKQSVAPENFMEVKYEDLCQNPQRVFQQVTKFCGLEWMPEFEQAIKKHPIKNANYKWQQDLTVEQQQIVAYFNGKH